jgi:hypothetical protein
MSWQYENWQERQSLNRTRQVTVQMEIIERYTSLYAPDMRLEVIIDGSYHVNVLGSDPYPDRSTEQLYKTLIDVLDTYQPRETIEGSAEIKELSPGEEEQAIQARSERVLSPWGQHVAMSQVS